MRRIREEGALGDAAWEKIAWRNAVALLRLDA